MLDREKVIKGLECCSAMSGDECRKCPYEHECRGTELPPYGIPHLAADALTLLREQEPIVRCGDCKYWNAGTCLNDKVSWQIDDCGCYPDFITDLDWFCAEGERK